MSIVIGNSKNFEKEISNDIVLVHFWAPWCVPCRELVLVLDYLDKKPENPAKIVKIDVEKCLDLAVTYDVTCIPMILIFKEGQVVDTMMGMQKAKNLLEILNSHK